MVESVGKRGMMALVVSVNAGCSREAVVSHVSPSPHPSQHRRHKREERLGNEGKDESVSVDGWRVEHGLVR